MANGKFSMNNFQWHSIAEVAADRRAALRIASGLRRPGLGFVIQRWPGQRPDLRTFGRREERVEQLLLQLIALDFIFNAGTLEWLMSDFPDVAQVTGLLW